LGFFYNTTEYLIFVVIYEHLV